MEPGLGWVKQVERDIGSNPIVAMSSFFGPGEGCRFESGEVRAGLIGGLSTHGGAFLMEELFKEVKRTVG